MVRHQHEAEAVNGMRAAICVELTDGKTQQRTQNANVVRMTFVCPLTTKFGRYNKTGQVTSVIKCAEQTRELLLIRRDGKQARGRELKFAVAACGISPRHVREAMTW